MRGGDLYPLYAAFLDTKTIVDYALADADILIPDTPVTDEKVFSFYIEFLKVDIFGSPIARSLFGDADYPRKYAGIPNFPFEKDSSCKISPETPLDYVSIVEDSNPNFKSERARFYPELGLIQANRQHLSAIRQNQYGHKVLDVSVFNLSYCFPFFHTNGVYWKNKQTKTIAPVLDIRFALLYTLAQKRWENQVGC